MTTKFKKNELVIIKTPHIFKRCGYPLDIQEEADRIKKEYYDEIVDTFSSIIGVPSQNYTPDRYGQFDKIIKIYAYMSLQQKSFGGHKRTIHTQHIPEIEGMVGKIADIKIAMTGTYCPGYSSIDHYGERDYEPASLINTTRNQILLIEYDPRIDKTIAGTKCQFDTKYAGERIITRPYNSFWIEAKNVEKLISETVPENLRKSGLSN